MKARILNLWDGFRSSFWFVPTLMTLGGFFTSLGMLELDYEISDSLFEHYGWLKMTPPAARSTLSSIASAMVTSAGVVFSITMVSLSITASQFGSRLIRTFRNNVVTHVTLGAFVATSLYCLLVLAAVRDFDGSGYVPHLSVYLGIVLAVFCLCTLIYFIDDMAISIQAQSVVRASAADLDAAIDRIFPERLGESPSDPAKQADIIRQLDQLGNDGRVIQSTREGYLQAIDSEGLMSVAKDNDLTLELLCQPGDFIMRDLPLVKIWQQNDNEVGEEVIEIITSSVITGSTRTPRQDVVYSINELVEVAVRALSPGINDPFTAMTCIDRLGAALGRLAGRTIPSPYRHDGKGHLRIIARPVEYKTAVDAAFDQIRHYARGDFTVSCCILKALASIAVQIQRDADRDVVRIHARMVRSACDEELHEERDRERISQIYDRIMEFLDQRWNKDDLPDNCGPADGDGSGQLISPARNSSGLTKHGG